MRALLSVYDKTGLVELAVGLDKLGVELVASGNTALAIRDAGVPVLDVAEVTGAPEMLGGRVKTLHPVIHGGILADRSKPDHLAELAARGITPIDLVISNLYPFGAEPSIEMIDIGGPTMVRAAAKNHDAVTIVTDPAEYDGLLEELAASGAIAPATRRRLARAAFAHVAAYDAAIVGWFDATDPDGDLLPPTIHLALEQAEPFRYGENPHQRGARYRVMGGPRGFWEDAVCHGGRALSYLNYFDAEAAWRLVHELAEWSQGPAAVIVKHANPCGAAVGTDLGDAYARAFASDPISAFGGIVALSGPVDLALAERIVANPVADVLIAPSIDPDALELFAARRKNMRPITAPVPVTEPLGFRQAAGGFLLQEPDRVGLRASGWRVTTERQPTEAQWRDAELAAIVCARTMSNAIVLVADGQVVGVGAGQQNRVDSARLAATKADGRAAGGAAASDAFFPFRDGFDACVAAGVAVVVQPGGSVRDGEIEEAATEAGVALVLTGERHFRH
jgi:phosphoribosylaminoimidazolecarboxamide formyltransferase/IMP cyclohydrolase